MKLLLALLLLLATSWALLTPLKSSNGEADIDSMANHILLEQMLSALTNKVSDQTRSLDTTTNDLNAMKSQYQTLEAKYQTLQTALESEKTLRDEKDQNITATIAFATTAVGYEVNLMHDITNLHDNEVLKFDGVKYNAGGGYHSTSGMFVAPVSDSYLFWCHVMDEDKNLLYIHLYHEGTSIAKGHVPGNYPYLATSITTIAYVKKGDNVWFTKAAGTPKLNGDFYSNYGGVLLRAY